MKIILAKSGGFCSGVKRAYNLIKNNYKEYPLPIYILGDLVHNNYVITETSSWGIKKTNNPQKIKRGTLIIPAHGCDPKIFSLPNLKKVKLVNATCPKVSKIIAKAKIFAQEGRTVLIFGDKNHVEVKAASKATNDKSVVISSITELNNLLKKKLKKLSQKKFGLISQTTQNAKTYAKIKKRLRETNLKIKILDTICSATHRRQEEVLRLAQKTDLMIIIGSPTSANSTRLYQISKKINQKTYFIDSPQEIKKKFFKTNKVIGISAGASTPKRIIESVIESVRKKWKVKNNK